MKAQLAAAAVVVALTMYVVVEFSHVSPWLPATPMASAAPNPVYLDNVIAVRTLPWITYPAAAVIAFRAVVTKLRERRRLNQRADYRRHRRSGFEVVGFELEAGAITAAFVTPRRDWLAHLPRPGSFMTILIMSELLLVGTTTLVWLDATFTHIYLPPLRATPAVGMTVFLGYFAAGVIAVWIIFETVRAIPWTQLRRRRRLLKPRQSRALSAGNEVTSQRIGDFKALVWCAPRRGNSREPTRR